MRLTRNFVGVFGAMVVVSGGLAANACSSSTTNPASPAEAGSPVADSGKPDNSVVPGPDGGGSDSPVADPCSKLGTNACLQCCAKAHPAGAKVYFDAFDKCICGPPVGVDGKCQTECAASDCNPDAGPSTAGDPCDLCETKETDDGGACGSKIDTACNAAPDCVAWNKCGDSCP